MRTAPAPTSVEFGPSVGEYHDRPIPAWVAYADGVVGDFVRIAKVDRHGGVSLKQLSPDEFVIAPGLIYRTRQ